MNRADVKPLYVSPNGDAWFLASDPPTGLPFVRHEANAAAGGQVTNIEIGAFLTGPHNPEHEALLRLIGRFIVGPQGDEADAKPSTMNAGKEWSDPELTELGNMLVRGCSIGEIARLLRRDDREVRDKVIEVGRACRGVCASVSKRA